MKPIVSNRKVQGKIVVYGLDGFETLSFKSWKFLEIPGILEGFERSRTKKITFHHKLSTPKPRSISQVKLERLPETLSSHPGPHAWP